MSVAVFAPEYLGHTIVHSLEVVNQGQNVSVADRNPLQHSDLISDHMLPPSHQSLVNDLGCIVSSSVDVDAFFHDRVRASSQRLAGLVSAWLDHWFTTWLSHAWHAVNRD